MTGPDPQPESARAIRVLHLGKYFPPTVGGMETYLHALCRAQARAGMQCSALVHQERLGLRSTREDSPSGRAWYLLP